MSNTAMLSTLCRQYTTLKDQDVQRLEEVASTLGNIADLVEADLFIDCLTQDPDVAVVVAQARPSYAKSLYEGSVIGWFAYRSKEPGVIRTLEIGMPTRDMRAITQENRKVLQRVSPITNREGLVVGVLIAEKDVSESVRTQQKLSVLAQTTVQLAEELSLCRTGDLNLPYHVTEGILTFDQSGICTYVNPAAENIYQKLGYLDRLEGLEFFNLTLNEVCFKDVLAERNIVNNDVKVGQFFLNIKHAIVNTSAQNNVAVVMLLSDVTETKRKEKELDLKKVAISEVHHRVKNNLQTIASLLQLQSRRIDNDAARVAFEESIGRVLSIAATHEILAGDDLDEIDIKNMLQRLLVSIVGHGLAASKAISIVIKGDTFLCSSDKATSIALVVNEATQNSLKYAFVGREKGLIEIDICRGAAFTNIAIIDDGIGFKSEQSRAESLGFTIIQRIVTEKLGGNLSIESSARGTKVHFDISHIVFDEKIEMRAPDE